VGTGLNNLTISAEPSSTRYHASTTYKKAIDLRTHAGLFRQEETYQQAHPSTQRTSQEISYG
jgi:hypothetical protein